MKTKLTLISLALLALSYLNSQLSTASAQSNRVGSHLYILHLKKSGL